MKLPVVLVAFLPKKLQERHICSVWDNKPDSDILDAYEDATEWIRLSQGIMKCSTLDKIAKDCQGRLDSRILPQIKKRELGIP